MLDLIHALMYSSTILGVRPIQAPQRLCESFIDCPNLAVHHMKSSQEARYRQRGMDFRDEQQRVHPVSWREG